MPISTGENTELNDFAGEIDESPAAFIEGTKDLETEILSNSLSALDLFSFDENGNLLLGENASTPQLVVDQIEQSILNSDYPQLFEDFVSSYDTQAQESMNMIRELSEQPEMEVSTAAIGGLLLLKQQAQNLFLGDGLDLMVLVPIREQLETVLAGMGTKEDLISVLTGSLLSNSERQSLLTNLVSVNSIDSFATANAQFNTIQSQESGLQWFTYRGGTIGDTRDFCRKRNGKFYHEKEIRDWGNIAKWQGRKKGTNPGNIFINRGGYNCLHSIMPVSITNVPKDVLLRNIKNGNWEPTDKEKKVLDLQ